MKRRVDIIGVGMTKFVKPSAGVDYVTIGVSALRDALEDASLEFAKIERAYVGYAYGDSGCGQRILYDVGQTGLPIINVNNNCTTGSTALCLAREAIETGAAECVLALGFEQMPPGAIVAHFDDRPYAMSWTGEKMEQIQGYDPNIPGAVQFFGGAGREYQKKFGTTPETFAMIASKARRHAEHNPRALFRTPLTVEEILASPTIFSPLTRFQCCPPTTGAAAAILVSHQLAVRLGIMNAPHIVAQSMRSDPASTFEGASMMRVTGYDMAREAAHDVYKAAGYGPDDLDVVELHDCFTTNELITYEAIELTPPGTAERFIQDRQNTYGGKVVTNPSGGLLAKGHPIGATGLAQCFELVTQLRGNAGPRQVEGARLALQHNIAPGTACVVTLYAAG